MSKPKLEMPSNPRYQPKDLIPYFGYDNLYRPFAMVEIANIETLHEIGVISKPDFKCLTTTKRRRILNITTTEVDKIEREITHHDARAWVQRGQEIVGPRLGRWLHLMLTSCDALDTANILRFKNAYENVTRPSLKKLILLFADKVEKEAATLQIGRTHRQHALPITAGFWLATILSRLLNNFEEMERCSKMFKGKISGAVGAYNAQYGLGITEMCGNVSFEERLLRKLGLEPARISTQILPPEYYTNFLFACAMTSATLGQFGRDCRCLMSTEIGEVSEPFEKNQVGSSTMAHKRNPITFENLEGTWEKTKSSLNLLSSLQISDHQRDLTGSSLMRDLPIFMINLQHQTDSLLREKNGVPFISRIAIDFNACRKNFEMSKNVILAEPLYIALQMAGYEGDAHNLVNHTLMPIAINNGVTLGKALDYYCTEHENDELAETVIEIWHKIPDEIMILLGTPERYVGLAKEKALEIAALAREMVATT